MTNRVADKNQFSVHKHSCMEVAGYTVDEIRNSLTPLLERLKVQLRHMMLLGFKQRNHAMETSRKICRGYG